MKKAILIFTLIQFCYSLSFGQSVVIQGFIHGIGTDTIFIKRGTALGRYPAEDTLIAKDGNFKYLLKCEEATFLTLLSKLKGKYVVLDFWGTWCSPCIKGFPKMKEYYEKYRTRVEFVGIACNDKEYKWREYLSKNELPWINLLNNENEIPNVSSLYGVSSLPTKVIIDPEGKIVTIVNGESEEFYNILNKTIPIATQ